MLNTLISFCQVNTWEINISSLQLIMKQRSGWAYVLSLIFYLGSNSLFFFVVVDNDTGLKTYF